MPSDPTCRECGERLQDNWRTCPFCGLSLSDAVATVEQPEAVFATLVVPEYEPPVVVAGQFARDQSLIGFGLIGLGVLGFMGGCGLIFSGSLTRLGSFESVVAIFLFGGGAMVAAVIAGTVIVSQRPSTTGDASPGVLGGLLAGFMAIGVCGLTVLAMFIYALESCLNGCK